MSKRQKKEKARARCDRRREYHDRVNDLVNAVREKNAARMAEYETKNAVCSAFFNAYHDREIKLPVSVTIGGVEWAVRYSSPLYWNESWSGGGFYLTTGPSTVVDVTPGELGYTYKGHWLDKPVPLDPPYQEDIESARRRFEFTVQKEMGSQFI